MIRLIIPLFYLFTCIDAVTWQSPSPFYYNPSPVISNSSMLLKLTISGSVNVPQQMMYTFAFQMDTNNQIISNIRPCTFMVKSSASSNHYMELPKGLTYGGICTVTIKYRSFTGEFTVTDDSYFSSLTYPYNGIVAKNVNNAIAAFHSYTNIILSSSQSFQALNSVYLWEKCNILNPELMLIKIWNSTNSMICNMGYAGEYTILSYKPFTFLPDYGDAVCYTPMFDLEDGHPYNFDFMYGSWKDGNGNCSIPLRNVLIQTQLPVVIYWSMGHNTNVTWNSFSFVYIHFKTNNKFIADFTIKVRDYKNGSVVYSRLLDATQRSFILIDEYFKPGIYNITIDGTDTSNNTMTNQTLSKINFITTNTTTTTIKINEIITQTNYTITETHTIIITETDPNDCFNVSGSIFIGFIIIEVIIGVLAGCIIPRLKWSIAK